MFYILLIHIYRFIIYEPIIGYDCTQKMNDWWRMYKGGFAFACKCTDVAYTLTLEQMGYGDLVEGKPAYFVCTATVGNNTGPENARITWYLKGGAIPSSSPGDGLRISSNTTWVNSTDVQSVLSILPADQSDTGQCHTVLCHWLKQ